MKQKGVVVVLKAVAVLILVSLVLISCSRKKPPVQEISETKILKGTCTWDIDSNTDGTGGTDIWWQQVNHSERYLVPQNGALLGVVKDKTFEKLNLGDLEKASLTDRRISASDTNPDIDTDTVLAVRTSEGNLVKLEVTGFDPLKGSGYEVAKYNMRLRYVLYRK